MKKTIAFILFVVLFLFVKTVFSQKEELIFSDFNELEKLRTTNPKLAWHLVDSIHLVAKENNYSKVAKYRIDFLYGRIASAMNRNRQAIDFFEDAFKSDSLQQNSQQYIRIAYLLCEELLIMQDNEKAMRYILLGLERARKEEDLYNESVCLGILSKVYYFNDQQEKACQTIALAIAIMENNKDNHQIYLIDKLIAFYSVQADYFGNAEEYNKAIESVKKGLEIIENKTPVECKLDEVNYHYWLASYYAMLACEYQALEQNDLARLNADKAITIIKDYKILRIDVYYKILYYYTSANCYDDAIKLTNFLKWNNTETDSINIFNQACVQFLAQAYEGKGNYKEACNYLNQFIQLTDALNIRARAESSMELATVYETAKKDAQIQANQYKLRMKNRLIVFLFIGLALLLIISYLIFRNSNITKKKNFSLYQRIKDQDKLAEEFSLKQQELTRLHQLIKGSGNEEVKNEEDELFEQLKELMKTKKIYTDANLSRKTLADMLNTNENYLFESIKKNLGLTFSEYITGLRLDYARELLSTPGNELTIEVIAIDSGFGSRNTFYRLFREQYGLTPVEFRRLATDKNE